MAKRNVAAAFILCQSCLLAAENTSGNVMILPRPVVEQSTGATVPLAPKGAALTISLPDRATAAVAEGMTLLRRRLDRLGHKAVAGDPASGRIVVTRCGEDTMARLLKSHGIDQQLESARLKQAYHLAVEPSSAGKPPVRIQAAHDWGLFYALVSLCQILNTDNAGTLYVPAVEVLDFPEIAHRLVKTGAANLPESVARAAAMLPLYKISQIGLQYHGQNSKHPETDFTTNISTLCPRLRQAGTIESIVYFCPFRGPRDRNADKTDKAYDFASAADRAAYAEYLLWIMAQGAHGIEVDYNDWPGSPDVPIADVLNLACQTVTRRYPEAYVLYCPPATGPETYRYMASPDMRRTLSRVPVRIWPLWTGMATLIREPLQGAQVERWTNQAGRRPFLWLNRVGLEVKESFSRPVPGVEGTRVFAGDRLPRELNRLFEGVHFNTSFIPAVDRGPVVFDPRELAYLATAADFVWNPHKWDPAESHRRAVRFVEVMLPLLDDGTSPQTAPGGHAHRSAG